MGKQNSKEALEREGNSFLKDATITDINFSSLELKYVYCS